MRKREKLLDIINVLLISNVILNCLYINLALISLTI